MYSRIFFLKIERKRKIREKQQNLFLPFIIYFYDKASEREKQCVVFSLAGPQYQRLAPLFFFKHQKGIKQMWLAFSLYIYVVIINTSYYFRGYNYWSFVSSSVNNNETIISNFSVSQTFMVLTKKNINVFLIIFKINFYQIWADRKSFSLFF